MVENVISKKKKSTREKIIKAIHKAHGLITTAANDAGVSPKTIYRYAEEFPSVQEAIDNAREELYDTAESKIYEKIKDGDTTMLIFFAKTRMKDRGYVERQEIDIPKEIPIKLIYDD